MSIKCSLLGHRFDESDVERDREENGSEVVVTITELESCSRCGEQRVVSENTEVTTAATPDADESGETGGPDGSVSRSGADSETGRDVGDVADAGDDAAEYDSDVDDAEILGADADEQGAGASTDEAVTDAGGVTDSTADEDAEDDAVIIDGDTGDDTHTDTSDDTGDVSASDAGGEEWRPETVDEPMDDWPEETKRDWDDDDADAGPTLSESASPTVTVPEGLFKCSECGFSTEVASSSLRAGDFCPECHRGTLLQHDEE